MSPKLKNCRQNENKVRDFIANLFYMYYYKIGKMIVTVLLLTCFKCQTTPMLGWISLNEKSSNTTFGLKFRLVRDSV